MARTREGMHAHEAVEVVMKRVPAARGSNKNLSPSNRAKKALGTLSAHQLCCVIDALWGTIENERFGRGQTRLYSTVHAYNETVAFFARKIIEKEA